MEILVYALSCRSTIYSYYLPVTLGHVQTIHSADLTFVFLLKRLLKMLIQM